MKRFIAFTNYYRRFIPRFAELAKPLNHLTKLKVPFRWTKSCQHSFDKLREAILSPTVLQYPDFAKEFILTVDASKIAAGAVLSQQFEDQDLPISFASKTFTRGEINKSIIEKELTAIYFAIKHYRPYLYGTHFTVRSDHKPLTYLFGLKEPSSKLSRMRLELEDYNFTIEYIKGKDNVIANALSRISVDELKLLGQHQVDIKIITRSKTKKSRVNNTIENSLEIDSDENIKIHCIEHEGNWKIPKLKFKVVNNEILKLEVFKKRKRLINIDASTSLYKDDKILILESAEKWASNDKMTLESFLKKLDNKATSLKLAIMQIDSKDEIFEMYTINEFKQMCNEYLNDIVIYIRYLKL